MESKQPIGLKNLGNTCFMNSVLQCVTHLPKFMSVLEVYVNSIQKTARRGDNVKFCLGKELIQLQDMPPVSMMSITPIDIFNNLKDIMPQWTPGHQCDAHEFLLGVLGTIEMEMKSLRKCSEGLKETFDTLFGATINTTIQCDGCKSISHNQCSEPVLEVQLQGEDIRHCLEKNLKPQQLDEDNKLDCSNCKKMCTAVKTSSIGKCPEILALHLCRFAIQGGVLNKNNKRISYSQKFTLPTGMASPSNIYKLKSFISHHGSSANEGHYTAFVKVSEKWFQISDSSVTCVPEAIAMKQKPYILFYELNVQDDQDTKSSTKEVTVIQNSQAPSPHQLMELLKPKKLGNDTDILLSRLQINNDSGTRDGYLPLKPLDPTTKYTSVKLPSVEDIKECLEKTKGKDLHDGIVTTSMPSSKNNRVKKVTVTKSSLRKLRLDWMYTDLTFLWLNDEVVNAYSLLIADSISRKYATKVYPLSSFFLNKLRANGPQITAQTFVQKDNLFAFQSWFIPVHRGMHWTVMVIDFKQKALYYADSIGGVIDTSPIRRVVEFISVRFQLETKSQFCWTGWTCHVCSEFPKQKNSHDCGVFALKSAEYILKGRLPNFTQEDMSRIRLELMYELFQGELLDDSRGRGDPKQNGALAIQQQPSLISGVTKTTLIDLTNIHIDSKPSSDCALSPKTGMNVTLCKKDITIDRKDIRMDSGPSPIKASMIELMQQRSQKKKTTTTKLKENIKEAINPTTSNVPATEKSRQGGASREKTKVPQGSKGQMVDPNKQSQSCSECGKVYQHRGSLHKHIASKHPYLKTGSIKCGETKCSFLCNSLAQLRSHLSQLHGTHMEQETKGFDSYNEFEEWKTEYERQTCTYFVKGSGTKLVGNTKITYFYCNRSGHHKSKSKGVRMLKSQGSSKLDAHCTAGFQIYHLSGGKIKAVIDKTHYGHTCSLGHIPLPDHVRSEMAGQIAMGVDFDNILDKIRNRFDDHLERVHLITKKDLNNIEKAFSLRGYQRHKDDATSVSLWIKELQRQGSENPVLFYKPQGQTHAIIGDNVGLDADDFAIVIQTKLQSEMLCECGNEKVVCVDATHGTNTYDFQLITLLVIDELGEGFPVCWCISNREDHILLSNFYRHVRKNTGPITPHWFMSDDAEQYHSAWVGVFGGQAQKLLCTWHVDRAWRKSLPKIKDKSKQISTYHTLRVLLEERDTEKFEALLQGAVLRWSRDPATVDFSNYFTTYYSQRYKQWAMCFRKRANINTNMFAEAFHRVIKHVYLKGTVNKRIDACISTLLKYARDKVFDRLQKVEKGKNTSRLQLISNRHKTSLDLSTDLVSISDSSTTKTSWKVMSSTSSDSYHVQEENDKCPYQCLLICRLCSVCVHNYSCTCLDSLTRGTICKHVHLVMRFKNCVHKKPEPITMSHIPKTQQLALHNIISTKPKIDGHTVLKDKLLTKLSNLRRHITETSDKEALIALDRQLGICLSLFGFVRKSNKTHEPANKQIKLQRSFHTTKRKRQTNIRIGKPTREQKVEITTLLTVATVPNELLRVLKLVCTGNCIKSILQQTKQITISPNEVLEDIEDQVIDVSHALLCNIKRYFTTEAYHILTNKVQDKHLLWRCTNCSLSTTTLNMIACDDCERWYHWRCVDVSDQPEEEREWFCSMCTKRRF